MQKNFPQPVLSDKSKFSNLVIEKMKKSNVLVKYHLQSQSFSKAVEKEVL